MTYLVWSVTYILSLPARTYIVTHTTYCIWRNFSWSSSFASFCMTCHSPPPPPHLLPVSSVVAVHAPLRWWLENCKLLEHVKSMSACVVSYNRCTFVLTNNKLSRFWNLGTNTVADDTAVSACMKLLHTGDGQGSTIGPLCTTWLPLLTPILLSWLPLPMVVQRFCSSGLDSECHEIARVDFFQTFGMTCDRGRFI